MSINTATTEKTATCSEARLRANKANAAKSTGPRTAEGKARSRRNALKTGMTGEGIVLPDELAARVEQARADWTAELTPRTAVEHELVHQIALNQTRFLHLAYKEMTLQGERQRDDYVLWDHDRDLEAARLGAQIQDQPALTVLQLQRSSHGCDWLRARWLGLYAAVKNRNGHWDDADRDLAANLLGGHAHDARSHRIKRLVAQSRDENPERAHSANKELLGTIRREVRRLRELGDRLHLERETPKREALRQGLLYDFSPEARHLRAQESAAWRRYERTLKYYHDQRKNAPERHEDRIITGRHRPERTLPPPPLERPTPTPPPPQSRPHPQPPTQPQTQTNSTIKPTKYIDKIKLPTPMSLLAPPLSEVERALLSTLPESAFLDFSASPGR